MPVSKTSRSVLSKHLNKAPISLGLTTTTLLFYSSICLGEGTIAHPLLTRDILALALIAILALTLFFLQLSRSRLKKTTSGLHSTQQELEQRVLDRTAKLRETNNKLYQEIAKHEETETLLKETQSYLQSIINSMPSTLIAVNPQGVVTLWNYNAEKTTRISLSEAISKNLFELLPELPVSLESIQQTIATNIPSEFKNLRFEHNNHHHFLDITLYPLPKDVAGGAVIRIDDTTSRVQLENTMIQTEKLTALGELSAGLAHEINNPLSAISQSTQNIQRRLSLDIADNQSIAAQSGTSLAALNQYLEKRQISKFLDDIKASCDRASSIVQNMLEFSRHNKGQQEVFSLNQLIVRTLELSQSLFNPDNNEATKIDISTSIIEKPLLIKGNPAEIEQVLLNILRNASQAIREQTMNKSGHIAISLFEENQQAQILISDNGPGMKETVRRHIFEPFYTTKQIGRGTGLGLSVSYFIITDHHNGRIDVESTLNEGTQFKISLPLSGEET